MAGAFKGQPAMGGGAFAQAEPSPREYLPRQEFRDEPTRPPAVATDDAVKTWMDYARPRVDVLKHLGIASDEAWAIIRDRDMPDVKEAERKAYQNNAVPPGFDDLLRR